MGSDTVGGRGWVRGSRPPALTSACSWHRLAALSASKDRMLRSLDRFEVEKRLLLGEICACEEATEARQLRPASLLG